MKISSSLDHYVESKSDRSSSLKTTESESSSWINMMVSGNIYARTATIYLKWAVLSMSIKLSLSYLLDYMYCPVIISSYLRIFSWSSFPSFLQHDQYVNSNTVIRDGSISKLPYIVMDYIELSQPHCHRLYIPGLASEDEQKILTRHLIRRGFIIFIFLVNQQVVSFLPRSLLSFVSNPYVAYVSYLASLYLLASS